jgi:hypothetical protein
MSEPARGHWCVRHAGQLAGLVTGIAFLAWGAISLASSLQPQERQAISIDVFNAGRLLPGRWLEVTGRLLREDRIIWPGDETRETYVPLVPDAWQRGQSVILFVRAREDNWGQPGRLLHHQGPNVTGFVARDNLDAELAQRFAEFEMPPHPDALILDYEAEPGSQTRLLGFLALGVGGLILLLTGVVWLIKRCGA